ncbi:hypothetical protein Kpol_1016p30 [Vanderwaltozyma polyspora DSM 70294]|uniref:Uncharacterized protein n=1 Tax=Vanderwaltozyma polyspora (strain ATCC 22028 / DSM 70294 / BCRC 21397 / CBS 2163 / NBRC 10782 / NRRL Y-8283 / UCD 57-17) TaxID=436907 RepID=A7TNU4_VANPO|nr:uncharacterized protein Kpol_1016p30 [Vanderwaltozyma polyspora DSM 70294]EDO16087.1 hypothetical protein Kpol_1016p30 [Vanderwaltozyma polyspora DSM 70294]
MSSQMKILKRIKSIVRHSKEHEKEEEPFKNIDLVDISDDFINVFHNNEVTRNISNNDEEAEISSQDMATVLTGNKNYRDGVSKFSFKKRSDNKNSKFSSGRSNSYSALENKLQNKFESIRYTSIQLKKNPNKEEYIPRDNEIETSKVQTVIARTEKNKIMGNNLNRLQEGYESEEFEKFNEKFNRISKYTNRMKMHIKHKKKYFEAVP